MSCEFPVIVSGQRPVASRQWTRWLATLATGKAAAVTWGIVASEAISLLRLALLYFHPSIFVIAIARA